jgi:hypothetical protein
LRRHSNNQFSLWLEKPCVDKISESTRYITAARCGYRKVRGTKSYESLTPHLSSSRAAPQKRGWPGYIWRIIGMIGIFFFNHIAYILYYYGSSDSGRLLI